MIRGKKIYFGLMILVTFIVSILYFSYAFFTNKKEEHGKLNIVAGTLEYKIESNFLNNNQIEVDSDSSFEFIIKVSSLNKVDSKYELYYTLSENIENIEVGYSRDTKDSTQGIISANETKEIKVIIKNNSERNIKVTFGVHGGLVTVAYDDIKQYGIKLKEASLDDLILAYTYIGNKTNPTKFPNKGEGYLVESINCTGADGVWDEINWGVKFSNITSKNIYCNAIIRDEVPEVYGNSIQTLYTNIYTNSSPTIPISKIVDTDNYYSGNYPYPSSLSVNLVANGNVTVLSAIPRTGNSYNKAKVISGSNIHTLQRETLERWINIRVEAGNSTLNIDLSNFKLIFKDGTSQTIQQAIDQQYIQPLVIISSFSRSQQYVWSNFYSILSGGPPSRGNYMYGYIIFKTTRKSALTGYSFTSNSAWNDLYDGISVIEYSANVKISTQPLK